MKTLKIITNDPSETLQLGKKLAQNFKGGEILCLCGNLGSGKTTLVKGIAMGLKVNENKVNSPTFVIMNAYEGKLPLYHFDFYRLENPQDIGGIGYDEFLYGQGVAVIEWAERFGALMPPENLTVELKPEGENIRSFRFIAHGDRYEGILDKI